MLLHLGAIHLFLDSVQWNPIDPELLPPLCDQVRPFLDPAIGSAYMDGGTWQGQAPPVATGLLQLLPLADAPPGAEAAPTEAESSDGEVEKRTPTS